MSQPNILYELSNRPTREEVFEIIKLYSNDALLSEAIEIMENHSHDGKYSSHEQLEQILDIVNNNDWGSITDEVPQDRKDIKNAYRTE